MRLILMLSLVFSFSCGDDGGSTDKIDSGTAIDGGGGTIDAMPNLEPCDFMNPKVVALGETVTSDAPSATCAGSVHFYRFTPEVAGAYSIDKKGEGSLGYCQDESGPGCICGVNINCCVECVLRYSLLDGGDLPAGSNNQIYIDSVTTNGPYTFTITGPL